MLKLGEKGLREAIKTCGLYQSKAKNILAACQKLLERHGGGVPADFEALTALPGVGRKTANVVMANAFQIPSIAVDTHVFRVSHRLGWAKGKTPDQVEFELQKILPRRHWTEAHHLLIYHGRNLCRARNPLCPQCPLTKGCRFYQEMSKSSKEGYVGKR
jgi:endonuclease-3